LEIRRGFTIFQLMTILEKANHSLIIIEHDSIPYEDSQGIVEYITQEMKQASHEATVLLYSPGIDPFLEELATVLIVYSTLRKGLEIHGGYLPRPGRK